MKISVLMTVFNQSLDIVLRAIDSVQQQQCLVPFELIVLDDGSEPVLGTALAKRIHELANTFPITYVYQQNQGQAAALNHACQLSKGEFIAIIDADDTYKPNHLASSYAYMQEYWLICSDVEVIADTEEECYVPDKQDISKKIHIKDCVVMGTLFGKKELFVQFPFVEHRALDALFYDTVQQEYPNKTAKFPLYTYQYYRNSVTSKVNQIKRDLE